MPEVTSLKKEAEKPSREAAADLGISYRHANQSSQVVEVIDHLKETGNEAEAEQLR